MKNIVLDQKQHFIEDPSSQPDIFAEGFVSDRPGEAHTASEALHTARMIIATELGKDPQLRQLTRDRFKQGAVVTVRPTEKGVNKIDDQHPYAVSYVGGLSLVLPNFDIHSFHSSSPSNISRESRFRICSTMHNGCTFSQLKRTIS